MTKKMMLLAVTAVAALAFAAMPAIASAAPIIDFSQATPIPYTGVSGLTVIRSGRISIECTSDDVKGEWTSSTTGTLEISCTGARNLATGISCNSSGQASGVITTEVLPTHLIYIKGFTKTAGLLVTPNQATGKFMEFTCGSLLRVVVEGNGVIGHLGSPKCDETSAKASTSFTASGVVQTYQEVEGNTTKYHLTITINGGAAEEASFESTEETTLSGGAVGTLTCL
ncbi:MAG: hypothetical protein ACTHN3_10100 [Solirubrobacterales bacterium]